VEDMVEIFDALHLLEILDALHLFEIFDALHLLRYDRDILRG